MGHAAGGEDSAGDRNCRVTARRRRAGGAAKLSALNLDLRYETPIGSAAEWYRILYQ
jgi:hypothetical protein